MGSIFPPSFLYMAFCILPNGSKEYSISRLDEQTAIKFLKERISEIDIKNIQVIRFTQDGYSRTVNL